MKKLFFIVPVLFSCMILFSGCDDDSIFYPKVITVNGVTRISGIHPGGLEKALFLGLSSVTQLLITDTIDARDFATMRDKMPNLQTIDLRNAVIAAYNGFEGSAGTHQYYYQANTIPAFAFYSPTTSYSKIKLRSVILPATLKSIGDYAFNGCSGLTGTIEIPASVTDTIGKSAFSFCTKITRLQLSAAQYIGESAFQGCSNLSGNITLTEGTKTIKSWAFAYCPKIATVSISSSVESIEAEAFAGSANAFELTAGNTSYSVQNGVLFNQDKSTLIQFPAAKAGTYSVPSGVTDIAPYAFLNSTALTAINLPASLGMIEDYAFSGCSSLSGNFPIPLGLWGIGQYVFDNCNQLTGFDIAAGNTTYTFTDGMLVEGMMSLKRCVPSKSGDVVIPSGILFIDNASFSHCTALHSVTIPDGILFIGHRAFYNCTGLTKVYANPPAPIDLTHSSTAFEGINKVCVLQVPTGSKAAYQTALGWKEFKTIVEI